MIGLLMIAAVAGGMTWAGVACMLWCIEWGVKKEKERLRGSR